MSTKVACRISMLVAVAMLGILSAPSTAKVAPVQLRCEYAINPLGIDVAHPRLAWGLDADRRGEKQTAYQILVAGSSQILGRDQGDLWDSGKVESDQSIHVAYAGRPLFSGDRVHWKVRVWDRDDRMSAYSEPACWEMGLLKPSDWVARWIAPDTSKCLGAGLRLGEWIWVADASDAIPTPRTPYRPLFSDVRSTLILR